MKFLILTLIVLTACRVNDPVPTYPVNPPSAPEPPRDPGVILPKYEGAPIPPDPRYPQTITIPFTISSTGIVPDGYVIYVNDTVILEVTSVDTAYTFSVEDLGISLAVPANDAVKTQFVLKKSGNFTYTAGSSSGTFYSVVRP